MQTLRSRMKSRHIRMSLEGYERLPFKPAWKQEYFNGCLVETPREIFVHASLPVAPRALENGVALRPAMASDEHLLHPLFVRSFADTIEFCDYPEAKLHTAAQQCLARFFQRPPRDVFPGSRVAIAPPGMADAGEPIGAVLVAIEDEGWALLDMIFVSPSWQRRGLATALAAAAMTALHEHGGVRTLVSRYHLGNQASGAWHHRFGFVDEPDLLVARLRYRAASDEGERRHWQREVGRIEAEGNDAAFPWIKSRRKALARTSHPI